VARAINGALWPRAQIGVAQTPAEIQEIRRKVQAGQLLTPEERQILQRVQARQLEARKQYGQEHPPRSSVGLTALPDLAAGTYKGEEGGLYPGGKNQPPAAHREAGVKLARQIAPIDGKIVLLAIGFSNPNLEFPAFQKLAAGDASVNPRLVTVNGCVGGQASSVIGNPQSNYWNLVAQKLAAGGVTAAQVQAVWIKEVVPGSMAPFPVDAKQLYRDLASTLRIVHDRFPNAKLAFLSSRTYGGYTEVGGSPEPWAYESGFAVKWVIADQIAGKPEVNYDPAKGPVMAPWTEWGPYLWTDGVKGRQDGFVYLREDVGPDGLHPSAQGQQKIASLMMDFFKADPATRPWFLK
jgi:hypothetical protein